MKISPKTLITLTAAAGLTLGLGLSLRLRSNSFSKEGKVNGYSAKATLNPDGRRYVTIRDRKAEIIATDWNNDGRFDDINLSSLPKGHPIERYSTLEKLEEVYSQIAGEEK